MSNDLIHDKIRANSYLLDVGVPRWASCLADGIKETEEDLIDVAKIEEFKRSGKANNSINTATKSPIPFEYKPEIRINRVKATPKQQIVKANIAEPEKQTTTFIEFAKTKKTKKQQIK